jgi:ParB-like chromosome segregation protein Spo0J
MTKPIHSSGFDPKRFEAFSIEEIALSLINEPRRYRSERRIAQYVKMIKEGSEPPPIELIETDWMDPDFDEDKPYEIVNGAHRYRAALLAGRETIRAVIAAIRTEGKFLQLA